MRILKDWVFQNISTRQSFEIYSSKEITLSTKKPPGWGAAQCYVNTLGACSHGTFSVWNPQPELLLNTQKSSKGAVKT